jgi:hypothetical protein
MQFVSKSPRVCLALVAAAFAVGCAVHPGGGVSTFAGSLLAAGVLRSTDFTSTAESAVDLNVPQNWLTQKVCVDFQNNVVPVDPFSTSSAFGIGCKGYSERAVRATDSLPYLRFVDPTGTGDPSTYYYANSYSVTSPGGEVMFVMDRQFTPQNRPPAQWYANQTFYPGHTHWDLYRMQDGWVSNAATRDNSGLNQTFFGNTSGVAAPYNGWVDFPFSYLGSFRSATHADMPVRDVHWEQSGLSWPLPTESAPRSRSTQTTWSLLQGYTFDSGKTMNTIVSAHQSEPQPNSANSDNGHMEIWYFTIPYGPSRWEVWSAASCLVSTCASTGHQYCRPTGARAYPYGDTEYTYYRINCVDWTRTMRALVPSFLPRLPIPETNMLANMHFSNDPIDTIGSMSNWTVQSVGLRQSVSRLPADTNAGKDPGVRYIQAECASACSLFQDVPIAPGAYSFGLTGRTESSTGKLQLSLAQVDSRGEIVPASTTSVTATISSVGDSTECSPETSVVNCSTYVSGGATIVPLAGAVKLRLSVSFSTPDVPYDITEAYLGQR